MFLRVFFFTTLSVLGSSFQAQADQSNPTPTPTPSQTAVTLAWDANPESNIAGYRVLSGTTSGQATSLTDVGSVTSTVVPNLTPGSTYYFSVIAYDDTGTESLPSAEVSATISGSLPVVIPTPPPAPQATPAPTPVTVAPTPAPTPLPLTTLTINATQVDIGGTIQVTLANSYQSPADLIAVYAVGGSAPIDYSYLNGTKTPPDYGVLSTTISFVMPVAGQFEFRYSNGANTYATSAQVTVVGPTPTPSPTPTLTPTPTSSTATFSNVSTRAYVQTGENVLIGGLIITGDVPKKVVMRAIGPSLISAGLSNALRDPILRLYDSTGAVIATNDNWQTDATALQAFDLAPTNDKEAAMVTTLAPGAYTAIVSGVNGATGIALFELYDVSPGSSRIGNIATRSKVQSGNNVMIGGFIVGGNGPSQVVVRALGPSLTNGGVTGVLADPAMELYNGNGSQIFANDNWRSSQEQQLTASGLAPGDDREPAIIATLQPGNYTAVVHGVGNSTGVGLVEVYNLAQ